ncbi:efflux RND transporter permease subunit [Pleionea sediminis]|uniref:efflux RND transporter permease subunit n=1 Tax=Pleionea sediminis TaxID=2569479 RepID=UPI0011857104|nr:MMPL family transporter [Pleionea sediminis]
MTINKSRQINLRYASLALFALLFVCSLTLPFTKNLHFSNDFRVYFSGENPQLKAFEQFEAEFSSHDSIFLVAYSKTNSWLESEQMQKIHQFTELFWELPSTTRVNSLSNHQYSYAIEDTLYTKSLIDYSKIPSELKAAIDNDQQLQNTYLSPDESVTLIQAVLEFDKNNPEIAKSIYGEAKDLVRQWREDYPDLELYLGGSVVSNVTLESAVKNDLILLVPISYLVISIGLLFFLRSIKATIITLVVVTLSIIFTFSIFSLFKQELTPVAGFVPSVILTLAVADCVHYITSYRYLIINEGLSEQQANHEAFNINLKPITITSLTTAIGVLFLNFSDSPPYRDLGNMVAIGVTLAWLLTITLLPVVLVKFPIAYKAHSSSSKEWLQNFSHWIRSNQKLILISTVLLILLSVSGLSKLTISENWSKYFSESFELTKTVNLLKEKFSRLHRYELVIDSNSDGNVNSPQYLNVLNEFLNYLESQSEVRHIQSYGYILKRLNQNMHGDDQAYYKMPDSRELASQYLLLYELSLPQGLGVNSFINTKRSAARTSIALEPMDSEQLLAFENKIQTYFQNLTQGTNYQLQISGMDHIFAHIAQRNIYQMILGSAIALIIISLLIGAVLKSVKYGLVSLIPNLFPGLIAYGLWGFSIGYIDLALSVVICMSLGIIVDDTVHFLSKYAHAKTKLLQSCEASLDYAFHIVGKALITTTVILVAGFSTVIASPLTPTSNTGALLCITLIAALIIDFTLLPITLYWLDKRKQDSSEGHSKNC